MTFVLRHWRTIGWILAVIGIAAFIHQRDARIRAEGEARVHQAVADSLTAVNDSLSLVNDQIEEEADSIIQEAEEIIAAIEEDSELFEEATNQTLERIVEVAPPELIGELDSLELKIDMERQAHEAEVANLWTIIGQERAKNDALRSAYNSAQAALAAQIRANNARNDTGMSTIEKIGWVAGSVAVGYLGGRLIR